MSSSSWVPSRTLSSPEISAAQMSHSGPAFYRPPKKGPPDQRAKYGGYDQNGPAGGNSVPSRYMATGPSGGSMHHQHQDGYSGPPSYNPLSPKGEHYYPPGPGPTDDHLFWSTHMKSYDQHTRGSDQHLSTIRQCALQQASLQRSLQTINQTGAPSQNRPSMGYPPHPQSQYHPSPPYVSTPKPEHSYPSPSSSAHIPYPQPVPASYTTASTPSGPRFTVQVKTAQPVTYSQSGRQAEQAYTPPPPRQHATCPAPQDRPHYTDVPGQGQGWYPPPPPPTQQAHGDPAAYKASSGSVQVPSRVQGPPGKKGQEQSFQSSKGIVPRAEEELDRLTKKLVYDMNHPPTEEYFGRCARCGDNVLGDGSGCIAMEQVFHVDCFTCITCHAQLRGKPFYALDKKSYCESCYISTLERCSKCSKPILDRILRAMGKAYHPRCFSCVVCGCCLDGVPFTVDATSQIHCIEDFHRKFAPRCSVCGEPIMPEPGQEETVRIVALDRSFHVNCYICEECGLLLSSEGEGRGCYPLDGHILCKSCSARRIQDLSAKISTDC
ncbi:hypothetical protein HF521_019756 [Silurus meridionalis]|uniref:LIM zinc-binding domain-containing protein n=1 Tax=Silurus meridionalis TaxID=175797 RepID=A0A8T0BGX6_SILME|nr:hypothetical protein HF521_019756 [Silurus meridionalis]